MTVFLVTGGAGFIGSHVCKMLARHGHLPVTYDNLSRGNAWAVRWGPLEQGDLNDRTCLSAVLDRWRPATVLHFAAFAYVAESMADPAMYYRNNVLGSLSLLETMRDAGIMRIVFSSSCATYGLAQRQPIGEGAPQNPINPYGASKLMVERMLQDYAAAYGLRSVILRYFNAAGADPEAEIGESHMPEPHVVPRAILAAYGRLPAFSVLGTDYPTPDGSAVRDYIHVWDLAAAHVQAAERLENGSGAEAFNLGTGAGVSVLELLRAVERVTGRAVPVEYLPRRPGDPPHLVAGCGRAREQLGWQPALSDLDTMVRTAAAWHMNCATP
jgi:UDP-arabinose 4-epimerase